MAENYRMINTKFWLDGYVRSLNKEEDRLFLYFLTNEHANILGIYELPIDIIISETRTPKEVVDKTLAKFEKDEKIYYRKNHVFVKNFLKYQSTKSPTVKKGVLKRADELPENVKKEIELILGKKLKNWLRYVYSIYIVGNKGKESDKHKVISDKGKRKEPFFSSLDFFKKSFRYKFGNDPVLDDDKSIELIEKKYSLFGSQEEIEKFITAYFESEKGEENGCTITACFTDHTINLWRTGSLIKQLI